MALLIETIPSGDPFCISPNFLGVEAGTLWGALISDVFTAHSAEFVYIKGNMEEKNNSLFFKKSLSYYCFKFSELKLEPIYNCQHQVCMEERREQL